MDSSSALHELDENKSKSTNARNQKKSDDFFYGINKSLYQNGKNSNPKTGTEFLLLPNSPEYLLLSDLFEPMYIPKQEVLENALTREIERFCFADSLLNKLVYDCVEANELTKDQNLAELGLDISPYYVPSSKKDTTLVFESRFESGNLRRAIQICENEYNLILKPDYFTPGNTQWYYFSVANTRKDVLYTFNIVNMMKPDSLYNSGMKPLLYSEKSAKQKKMGWFRDGEEVCYFQNNLKKKNGGYYYTLSFMVRFAFDYDTVYMSHCYPYTYSQLGRFLDGLEKDGYKRSKIRRKVLCQTIAGNDCEMIEISDFSKESSYSECSKREIILSSRVHPGESMASYVIEAVIDFLSGPSSEAKQLRESFLFKIVPMLNIDGVINGNYRCNLAGVDLNRQWINPHKTQHPTIFALKNVIKKSKEDKLLSFFCDFHGHSRKKNIFMYGCSGRDQEKKEMIFPLIFRNNSHVFSFKDCSFALQKDREGSARIALWREFLFQNCYTLEMSFCGSDFGKYEYFHFNLEIYKEIAQSFALSLLEYHNADDSKLKFLLDEIEQLSVKPSNEKKEEKAESDGDSDYSNEEIKMEAPTILDEPPKKSIRKKSVKKKK